MADKVYTPIPPPSSAGASKPAELNGEQKAKYEKVLEHFTAADYSLPGVENGALHEEEKFWLTYECLLRYLRAVKWSGEKEAIQRLEATLKWRREFGFYDTITPELVEPEAVTGKEILFGFDSARRPAFYMFPSRQNTEVAEGQIQFAIFMLERNIDLMGAGVESMAWLINYADKAGKSGKSPSFSTSKKVLDILQSHYPERLGLALIINVPFILTAFFKLITPLIDPVTRAKMHFNPKTFEAGHFAKDMMMKESWDGGVDFEYKHDKYWPALIETCTSRRNAWKEEWKKMGGTIGLKEWDYKTAAEAKLATPVTDNTPA